MDLLQEIKFQLETGITSPDKLLERVVTELEELYDWRDDAVGYLSSYIMMDLHSGQEAILADLLKKAGWAPRLNRAGWEKRGD